MIILWAVDGGERKMGMSKEGPRLLCFVFREKVTLNFTCGALSHKPALPTLSFSLSPRYAASVGAAHIYTSAKLNKGLDEAFVELATREFHKSLLRVR